MNLIEVLERGLFAVGELLRAPVVLLLWGCVAWATAAAGATLVEGLARRRHRASFSVPRWTRSARKAEELPAVLRGLHDEAASIARDEHFVPHLEECLARHESAARGALDGPRALVKAGPSLGLLGTLIPMGSSLAALSQGNLEAMSGRMVAAFTSTIIGLATGTLAFSIVARRQRWLEQDLRELRLLADLIAGERSR
jgi:biopolymer transport protein ExbB/TolQ